MAIKQGAAPEAQSAASRVRVVIKLAEAPRQSVGSTAPDLTDGALSEVRRVVPELAITPYFANEQLRVAHLAPFDRYVSADVPNRDAGEAMARKLRALDAVQDAYVEGGPVEPPVNPANDPLSQFQGYLNAAPAGIDARWAWSLTDGAGIGFVDLERGWTLDHVDLAAAGIGIISGLSQDYHGHGTAVLGEIVGVDNDRGVVGIAPRARARVVSQWRNASTYGTAAAILSAGQAMSAGDVLLLEAQTRLNGLENLPVEVETAVFDAIRFVVDQGIVVIEAGGNGGHDLDDYKDAGDRKVFNRDSADFRDSGAIMVGAGSAAHPHVRLDFSNYGSRIDCYAWGGQIETTGDGYQGTSTTEYTASFGGTSGASPMVAGAAVLLQAWRRQAHGQVFDPGALRQMLASSAHNTASANPASDRIGVMPNLRAVLEAAIDGDRFRFEPEKYLTFVYILIGLIDDLPGTVFIPGHGPSPVDPGWGKVVKELRAPQRDLLAALAVNEIAGVLGDQGARARLTEAAAAAMHNAVDRIARAPGR